MNFIGSEKYKSNFILLQVTVWSSKHLVHEQSFVKCMFCSLCQKYDGHTFAAYLWVLCSIPLPYLFALMLELSCFLITVALFYNLKSTIMIPPDVFLLLGITLAICGLS